MFLVLFLRVLFVLIFTVLPRGAPLHRRVLSRQQARQHVRTRACVALRTVARCEKKKMVCCLLFVVCCLLFVV